MVPQAQATPAHQKSGGRRGAGSPPASDGKVCERACSAPRNPPSNPAAQPLTRWCGPEARRSAGAHRPSERGPAPNVPVRTLAGAGLFHDPCHDTSDKDEDEDEDEDEDDT